MKHVKHLFAIMLLTLVLAINTPAVAQTGGGTTGGTTYGTGIRKLKMMTMVFTGDF